MIPCVCCMYSAMCRYAQIFLHNIYAISTYLCVSTHCNVRKVVVVLLCASLVLFRCCFSFCLIFCFFFVPVLSVFFPRRRASQFFCGGGARVLLLFQYLVKSTKDVKRSRNLQRLWRSSTVINLACCPKNGSCFVWTRLLQGWSARLRLHNSFLVLAICRVFVPTCSVERHISQAALWRWAWFSQPLDIFCAWVVVASP